MRPRRKREREKDWKTHQIKKNTKFGKHNQKRFSPKNNGNRGRLDLEIIKLKKIW